MPIDSRRVRLALSRGLSSVCSSCEHWWEAADRGLSNCGKDCGGPIGGRDFPLYKGPRTRLDNTCFAACVSTSDYVVRIPGGRDIGVCSKHLKLLDSLEPEARENLVVEVRSPQGLVVPRAGRYTSKSLGEVIAETEAGWDDG